MRLSGTREFELLKKIGFVRMAGTKEELQAAEILREEIKAIGFESELEPFEIEDAVVTAEFEVLEPYSKKYKVTGYKCCESTPEEGMICDFVYAEDMLDVNLADVRGKFVLVNGIVRMEQYRKLIKAGVAGFMTMNGSLLDKESETDLATRKIRAVLASCGLTKALNIRIADAFDMIKRGASKVKVTIKNKNEKRTSHNIYVTVPGTQKPEEVISFGAHYDSVEFSTGVYDNGAGSVILMEILRYFKENPPKRTVKFHWYGSEEIGLEGSKHFVKEHKDELKNHKLMINVDVAGPVIGAEIAMVTADISLMHYVDYFMKTKGYAVKVKHDIYSSDCIPFADNKVPAISFARFAPHGGAFIHERNDVIRYLSPDKLLGTTKYILEFACEVINSAAFPVPAEIPQEIVEKVDKYLYKKELEENQKQEK